MNYYEEGYEDGYYGRPHKGHQSHDYDLGYETGKEVGGHDDGEWAPGIRFEDNYPDSGWV